MAESILHAAFGPLRIDDRPRLPRSGPERGGEGTRSRDRAMAAWDNREGSAWTTYEKAWSAGWSDSCRLDDGTNPAPCGMGAQAAEQTARRWFIEGFCHSKLLPMYRGMY
jgi:hypothetical protein